jgi:hypothetical protein
MTTFVILQNNNEVDFRLRRETRVTDFRLVYECETKTIGRVIKPLKPDKIGDPPSQSLFNVTSRNPSSVYSSDLNLRRVTRLKQETRLTFPSFKRES